MDFNLQGKKVLVTGSTRGIGFATASLFHEEGAEVIFSGTNQEKLNEIAQQFPERAHTLVCDLNDSTSIDDFAKEAMKMLGEIDVLVCNAGITRDGLAMRMKEKDWDDVININLKACFLLNQKFVKYMLRKKCGSIINISSISGFLGNIGQANYAAAKAGLVGMTKTFAKEFGAHGIRFNCVAPGFTETDMTNAMSDKIRKQLLNEIPMKKYGTPNDIAQAILFLASEKCSRYITGETIHVNGGLGMF